MVELSPQHECFVQHYMKNYNVTQAAKKAGYQAQDLPNTGCRILARADVKMRIKEIQEERKAQYQVSEAELVEQLQKIAFSDITDFVSWDENGVMFFDPEKVDGQMITEIDVNATTTFNANGEQIDRVKKKMKFADKMKAIELLGKNIGMFSDNVNHTGKVNITIIDDIGLPTNDETN